MEERIPWTEDEIVLALKLYIDLKGEGLSINKIRSSHEKIFSLSLILSSRPDGNRRNRNSVYLKLRNIANNDPDNLSPKTNGSRLEKPIWDRYSGDHSALNERCAQILEASASQISDEDYTDEFGIPMGYECMINRKVRINQSVFRATVLHNYGNKCCITGISNPRLLVASHIMPWSVASPAQRTDPSNGLCLNGLHDLAFDKGLMTLNTDLTIELSPSLKDSVPPEIFKYYFEQYSGKSICPPSSGRPKKKYIEYHRQNIFLQM